MRHLLFLSFESFAAVGHVHSLVHLVRRVHVKLHHGTQAASHVGVQLVLHLDSHVFVFVVRAELLKQLFVLSWSFSVTIGDLVAFWLSLR